MAKTRKKVISYKDLILRMSDIRLPLSYALTPENYDQEKEKFFDSDTYNPQFQYPDIDLSETIQILKDLVSYDHVEGIPLKLSSYIRRVVKSKYSSAKLIESIGNDSKFIAYTTKKYYVPTDNYAKKSTRILRGLVKRFNLTEIDKSNERQYKAEEVVEIFKEFLSIVGVPIADRPIFKNNEEYYDYLKNGTSEDKWFVGFTKTQSSRTKVGSKFRTIYVGRNSTFGRSKVLKLLIHEIGTHVLRSVNGFNTGYEIFGKPTISSYLYTEEGLAAYNEMKYGLLTRKTLNRYALLNYGVYLAHKYHYTFRQLYNLNLGFKPPSTAFNLAYQVKRGLTDTANSGGYTKDAVYLKGFLLTRKRIMKDPLNYERMYAGKFSYSWLKLLEKGVIPYPKAVPDEEKIQEFLYRV
jgi:hypothetical protein